MMADLYRRWLLDLWNGDFELAHELVTPDFTGHWPGMDVSGPEGLIEALRQGHEPFGDVKVTLDVGPIVDGDLVSARWTFGGAYRGGIPGATAAEGTRVAFSGHDILRARDGRFSEYWVISDAQTFGRQLGIG
ncbi:SnoaL-like polyketide cyclase [Nonomuraea solani]|uniref:SnoaL-like polyketide cyclase n=1 Tax=Nonomuraea solani TaxID=1144553 RepID=A0A1H6A2Y3_9ACTN|nr:ester cyclase [Nonomuraea solani]SEG42722.1 SnoaL-like polyketide cyclase [Nonomuraea solani]